VLASEKEAAGGAGKKRAEEGLRPSSKEDVFIGKVATRNPPDGVNHVGAKQGFVWGVNEKMRDQRTQEKENKKGDSQTPSIVFYG